MTTRLSITKHEQSALIISTGATTIGIDFGSLTMNIPKISHLDGVLVSHVHPDHFSLPHLDAFAAPVWAANEVVERLAHEGRQSSRLQPETKVVIGDLEILPVEVDHGSISTQISNLGFLLRTPYHTIFFAGDMAVSSPLPLTAIDVLLIPVGGGKVFNAHEAATYVRNVGHQGICIPLHYHGNASPHAGDDFQKLLGDDARVHVLNVGQTLEVGS